MATFEEILKDCVQQALGMPRDEIQTDIRDLVLSVLNEQGRIMWDSWPWPNEKMDEFTAPAADADGIIVFASTVDVVRAVKGLTTGTDTTTRIWNQDDLIAAADGVVVSEDRFIRLADEEDESGVMCRRIQVDTGNAASSYRVLALKRWTDAIVDPDYDPDDPDETPTDYRVLEFILDRVEPALRAFAKDALRVWAGDPALNNGSQLFELALRRERLDNDTERRVNPRAPLFEDVGDWCG